MRIDGDGTDVGGDGPAPAPAPEPAPAPAPDLDPDPVSARLATRLGELRAERGWSLGELAERSGISRSTLSRAERVEISPTASLLNRLCAVYGRTMSQLLSEVEAEPALLVRAADQAIWEDKASGFVRRSVSPPHAGLRGELVEGRLAAGADIAYDRPPVPGLEQHIWVLEGALDVTAQDVEHRLDAGDCLRLRVWGPTRFGCPGPEDVRYALAVVLP
ncbi:helix-turn-helix domain-containing protein [Streptomyces sp. NPDC058246]|uniref:helix-turn-helix domain-containing protein n=1 Tax=Streptomyces sp. NPDC058246 TaxID=3346400 RepID=UPI0036EBC60D